MTGTAPDKPEKNILEEPVVVRAQVTAIATCLLLPAPKPVKMQLAQIFLYSSFCLLSVERNTPSRTVMRHYFDHLTIKKGATGGRYAILSGKLRPHLHHARLATLANMMKFGLHSATAPCVRTRAAPSCPVCRPLLFL